MKKYSHELETRVAKRTASEQLLQELADTTIRGQLADGFAYDCSLVYPDADKTVYVWMTLKRGGQALTLTEPAIRALRDLLNKHFPPEAGNDG